MKALKRNVKVPFFPVPLDIRKTFAVWRFPVFARLSFWYDEDEYTTTVLT
jgi:hypothetical protein